MGYIIQNLNQKRQFLCNVTHTCMKFFTKTIQKQEGQNGPEALTGISFT